MLGGTHSHGTGNVTSGIEDQVRDAVLILVAPIPERDLVGTTRQRGDAPCPGHEPQAAAGPGHLVITGGTGGSQPQDKAADGSPRDKPTDQA